MLWLTTDAKVLCDVVNFQIHNHKSLNSEQDQTLIPLQIVLYLTNIQYKLTSIFTEKKIIR